MINVLVFSKCNNVLRLVEVIHNYVINSFVLSEKKTGAKHEDIIVVKDRKTHVKRKTLMWDNLVIFASTCLNTDSVDIPMTLQKILVR